jgi:hypothetical protein
MPDVREIIPAGPLEPDILLERMQESVQAAGGSGAGASDAGTGGT